MSVFAHQVAALARAVQAPPAAPRETDRRHPIEAATISAVVEILGAGPARAEKIGRALGMSTYEAAQALKTLRQAGLVRNLGGKPSRYGLVRGVAQ